MRQELIHERNVLVIAHELARLSLLRNARLDGLDVHNDRDFYDLVQDQASRSYTRRQALLLSTDERVESNRQLRAWNVYGCGTAFV